jgi:hypothetical protein
VLFRVVPQIVRYGHIISKSLNAWGQGRNVQNCEHATQAARTQGCKTFLSSPLLRLTLHITCICSISIVVCGPIFHLSASDLPKGEFGLGVPWCTRSFAMVHLAKRSSRTLEWSENSCQRNVVDRTVSMRGLMTSLYPLYVRAGYHPDEARRSDAM